MMKQFAIFYLIVNAIVDLFVWGVRETKHSLVRLHALLYAWTTKVYANSYLVMSWYNDGSCVVHHVIEETHFWTIQFIVAYSMPNCFWYASGYRCLCHSICCFPSVCYIDRNHSDLSSYKMMRLCFTIPGREMFIGTLVSHGVQDTI